MKKMKFVFLTSLVMLAGAANLSAALTYSPPTPRTGETVTFTLSPSSFPAGAISWNFGDNSPVQSGTALTITHVYVAVGSYTVSASYFTTLNAAIPHVDQATVMVTDPRQITFSPPQPKAKQAVVFTALNFYSACIRWDFGDGAIVNGSIGESHTYASAGGYTVHAYEECGATYGAAVTIAVVAKDEEPPPVTPTKPTLAVSIVSLYFAGGKADVSVAKDFAPLQAFADIQVAGTGILQWQWLVDGMAVKADTLAISFGNKFTLDSGKIPGLPTAIPGRHLVTLRFQNPKTDFSIPVITYFVALRGPAPVIRRVTPATLAPGAEYKLELKGAELTPGTEIIFPAPLALLKKATILSSTAAQATVFVAPTAAAGTKLVTVKNEYGESSGPGQVTIASPHKELPGPHRPTPTPKPLLCPDIAITEISATLLSTQLGDPSADIPHDKVRLQVTLENVGNKAVPSDFLMDFYIKKNGVKLDGRGYPIFSTSLGAPGSRFVIDDIVDSFPHGVATTYSVEAMPLYNECETANNQASLTIDETQLHPKAKQVPDRERVEASLRSSKLPDIPVEPPPAPQPPFVITTETLTVTGKTPSVLTFSPVTVTTEALTVTGKKTPLAPFTPVSVTTETLTVTGKTGND